jgi:hypothetical protein
VAKHPVCAVCDRYGIPSTTYQLQDNDTLPSGFRSFLAIPHHSIHYGRDEFVFGHPTLDNLMLCRQGIESSEHATFKVHVCEDCWSYLDPNSAKRHVPAKLLKYSLANKANYLISSKTSHGLKNKPPSVTNALGPPYLSCTVRHSRSVSN